MSSHSAKATTTLPLGPDSITPVGVDVGSARYLFAAASPADGVGGAATVNADYAHRLYSEFQSATHRLGTAPDYVDDQDRLGDLVARYWPRLRRALECAADQVVGVARAHPRAVVVLEDLSTTPRPLVEAAHGAMAWADYCPAVAQQLLADRALDAGLAVAYVPPEYTSQLCHECGTLGDLGGRGCETLTCVNDDCTVGEVCRDRSAAVTIARRYHGEA
ncbi:zinc ribbon domain-containing protein [Haloarcula onubensis]|uniref:Transposase n=1 Tax=Haloarcula onubensis TaxID=2950539 RepID=A0ABU2FWT5_9EURY|nr:zinc ribbon domain-containing protein [Halomicroarcula sp. S3CR25-11]MDS0284747.1 transposase [Halomicroarcula sp. S3CR25-11]